MRTTSGALGETAALPMDDAYSSRSLRERGGGESRMHLLS